LISSETKLLNIVSSECVCSRECDKTVEELGIKCPIKKANAKTKICTKQRAEMFNAVCAESIKSLFVVRATI